MPLLHLPRRRRGVTLLELLLVLTLLGVTTALVLPAFRVPASEASARARLVTLGRGEAIRRAQSLRLTVSPSGAWWLRVESDGQTVDSGAVQPDSAEFAPHAMDMTFDALGGCLPSARATREARTSFDPLACVTASEPGARAR